MKKMLLFLTALAAWHGVAAQDVILLRNADEIKARVTEITETDVLCKMWDDPAKMLREMLLAAQQAYRDRCGA